jgi:hypothetical protein
VTDWLLDARTLCAEGVGLLSVLLTHGAVAIRRRTVLRLQQLLDREREREREGSGLGLGLESAKRARMLRFLTHPGLVATLLLKVTQDPEVRPYCCSNIGCMAQSPLCLFPAVRQERHCVAV